MKWVVKPAVIALVLVVAGPVLAGERTLSEATPALDWDLYHDRQDACREADRIAAQCKQGYCDEAALRQARRACSPFGSSSVGARDERR
jgi:hypothetical protein